MTARENIDSATAAGVQSFRDASLLIFLSFLARFKRCKRIFFVLPVSHSFDVLLSIFFYNEIIYLRIILGT